MVDEATVISVILLWAAQSTDTDACLKGMTGVPAIQHPFCFHYIVRTLLCFSMDNLSMPLELEMVNGDYWALSKGCTMTNQNVLLH